MCYAIPGKVVKLTPKIAVIDYFGEQRNVLNEFLDVKVGDYVYAQGGILINKIPAKEAIDILKLWKEIFFKLKKTDNKLSKVNKGEQAAADILAILEKVNLNKELTKDEMLKLIKIKKKRDLDLMLKTANNVRLKELDNACCVHGIIEFSNHCQNDCFYCGIRKSQKVKRYRMSLPEIIKVAKYAANELGFKALVLQSGEDLWYGEKKLIKLVKEIRKLNVLIFLSVGVRSKETYQKLYDAGARAVLLRFETANKKVFKKLRPGTDFAQRIKLIKDLKKIGYIVATGFLVGLPGETDEDLVDNIRLTKSLHADMYSFGPLIPAAGTPLENQKLPSKNTLLKTIALVRLIDKQAKILVTTALETLKSRAKKEGLLAGANSLMINVTPSAYRQLYHLYPDRPDKDKKIEKNIKETVDLLYSIGRAPTDLGL